MLSTRIHLTDNLKIKLCKYMYHVNTNCKEAGVDMSILDKRNCRLRNIITDKAGHFIILKVHSSRQRKNISNKGSSVSTKPKKMNSTKGK